MKRLTLLIVFLTLMPGIAYGVTTEYNRVKRIDVTVNSRGDSTLTDFPFYVEIQSSATDSRGTGVIELDDAGVASKSDLAVLDTNGNTVPYYFERFDPASGVYKLWVRSDITRDGTAQFQLAYGNGASDYAVTEETVWDGVPNLFARYDFSELDTTKTRPLRDSTSNNNDGFFPDNPPSLTGGLFSKAYRFTATDTEWIKTKDKPGFSIFDTDIGGGSVLLWTDELSEQPPNIQGNKQILGSIRGEWNISMTNDTPSNGQLSADGGAGDVENKTEAITVNDGWDQHVYTLSKNNGTFEHFLNGTLNNRTSPFSWAGTDDNSGRYTIGNQAAEDQYYDGRIDSIQFYTNHRRLDTGWIRANYDMSPKANHSLLDAWKYNEAGATVHHRSVASTDPRIVNDGTDTAVVTMTVHNDRPRSVDVMADTITFGRDADSFTVVSNPVPSSVPANDTVAWDIVVTSTADPGEVSVDGGFYAVDSVESRATVLQASSDDPLTLEVFVPGGLDIRAVEATDTSVANNNSDTLEATVSTFNERFEPTALSGDTLTFTSGDWTKQSTARPDTIASRDTGVWTVTYTVQGDADSAVATPLISGHPVDSPDSPVMTTSSDTLGVDIQTDGQLTVVSVAVTEDTYVMRDGAGGDWSDTVTATLVVRNDGDAAVNVTPDSDDLAWTNELENRFDDSVFPRSVSVPSFQLQPGEDKSIIYRTVLPDSGTFEAIGPVTVNAQANRPAATDDNTGEDVSDPDGTGSDATLITFFEGGADTVYLRSPGLLARADVPPGVYPDGTEFSVDVTPQSSCIEDANKKASNDKDFRVPSSLTDGAVRIDHTKNSTEADTAFDLSVKYDPSGVDPDDRNNIRLVRLNESTCEWEYTQPPDSQLLNAFKQTVTAKTHGFSFYQPIVAVTVPPDLSNFSVAPNPYKPNDGNSETGEPYDGTAGSGIVFANLPTNTTVKIYTLLGGEYVDSGRTDSGGDFHWDVRNETGRAVASGWYLYRVKDTDNNTIKTGKLAIVR